MTKDVGPSAAGEGTNGGKLGDGHAVPSVERAELSQSEYLTKQQVADLFQISVSTVDNRIDPESRWHCPEFPIPRMFGPGCASQRWPRIELDAYALSRPTKQFPRTRRSSNVKRSIKKR